MVLPKLHLTLSLLKVIGCDRVKFRQVKSGVVSLKAQSGTVELELLFSTLEGAIEAKQNKIYKIWFGPFARAISPPAYAFFSYIIKDKNKIIRSKPCPAKEKRPVSGTVRS
jgi:hypothetical protein